MTGLVEHLADRVTFELEALGASRFAGLSEQSQRHHRRIVPLDSSGFPLGAIVTTRVVPMNTHRRTAMLLVRHGQSIWNVERRWQGRADPALSDHGRHQASLAAANLGNVDVIVSSPLSRALETAVIISSQLGVGPVQMVEDLQERDAGAWSGLTTDEIETDWPGWINSNRRPEGWEHDWPLLERALTAFESIIAEFEGADLLLVSHGGLILVVEEHLRVSNGRIPNLHGRLVHHVSGELVAGDRLELIPPESSTGGTGGRV